MHINVNYMHIYVQPPVCVCVMQVCMFVRVMCRLIWRRVNYLRLLVGGVRALREAEGASIQRKCMASECRGQSYLLPPPGDHYGVPPGLLLLLGS